MIKRDLVIVGVACWMAAAIRLQAWSERYFIAGEDQIWAEYSINASSGIGLHRFKEDLTDRNMGTGYQGIQGIKDIEVSLKFICRKSDKR